MLEQGESRELWEHLDWVPNAGLKHKESLLEGGNHEVKP